MTVMLGRRHRNSVTEEGGMNTGRTWTEDGKKAAITPVALYKLSSYKY